MSIGDRIEPNSGLSEKDLERLAQMRLIDDTFFSEALKAKKEAVQYILNMCTQADKMFSSILAKEVRSIKETERGRVHMCELMEKMREEAAQESARQRTYEIMDAMITAGVLSDKDIAMYTDTTAEEVRERRNQKLSA